MTDDYDYIHQASNERLAEMLEGVGLDLGVTGNLEACAIIGEAVRRLEAFNNRPIKFNHKQFE